MKKVYISFNVSKREMRGYADLTSLAGDIGEDYHGLRRRLKGGVVYTGDYFIGIAPIEKSNRGGGMFK